MFTRKALTKYVLEFLNAFTTFGYRPEKVVLFGSYAYGRPHELSDIDLAIWDSRFSGCRSVDTIPFIALASRFNRIELHTYNPADQSEDPFQIEILKKGILIPEDMYLNYNEEKSPKMIV